MKFRGKQLPKTPDCPDAGGLRKSSIGLKKLYQVGAETIFYGEKHVGKSWGHDTLATRPMSPQY